MRLISRTKAYSSRLIPQELQQQSQNLAPLLSFSTPMLYRLTKQYKTQLSVNFLSALPRQQCQISCEMFFLRGLLHKISKINRQGSRIQSTCLLLTTNMLWMSARVTTLSLFLWNCFLASWQYFQMSLTSELIPATFLQRQTIASSSNMSSHQCPYLCFTISMSSSQEQGAKMMELNFILDLHLLYILEAKSTMLDIRINPNGMAADVHHYRMLQMKDFDENTWSIQSRINNLNAVLSPSYGTAVNRVDKAWSGFLSFLSKNYSRIVEYIRRMLVKVKQFKYKT